MVQADNNVRVTSQVVSDYIKDAVQPRLAFDIPSSWRLFMVSLTSTAGAALNWWLLCQTAATHG